MIQFGKQKSPLQKKMKQVKKKIRFVKAQIFLLITLPIAIVTIGRAVLKEYVKVKVRQAATEARSEVLEEMKEQDENGAA